MNIRWSSAEENLHHRSPHRPQVFAQISSLSQGLSLCLKRFGEEVAKLQRINSIRMKVYIFCLFDIKVALEGETLPQSMTTDPGFTQLLLTIWGLVGSSTLYERERCQGCILIGTLWGNLPTATTKMSAVRHTEAKSAVLTCANKWSWIVDWPVWHSHNLHSAFWINIYRVSQ